MSIRVSCLPRSASQPLLASPTFPSRRAETVRLQSGAASPGAPRVSATYAAPSGVASRGAPGVAGSLSTPVYAGAPPQASRAATAGQPRAAYTGVAGSLSTPVYAGAPPPSLTYAAPPTWGANYGREQLVVEPNGLVERVYAMAPPATLTYAAPVQEIVEIIRDDSEALALRSELQECVALVQEYQRKNGALVQLKNDLEKRLSGCEVRNGELQQENNNQREEINMLRRNNEELTSLNIALQEKVRDLQANQQKPEPKPRPAPSAPEQAPERTPPSSPPLAEGSDDDKIEKMLRDFMQAHPDFPIDFERTKPLWYQFSGPLRKKVMFKVQGNTILARVGGGFSEAVKWLTEQCQQYLEAEGLETEEQRENSPGAGMKGRQLGSVSRAKRSSSGGRNSVNSMNGR